MSDIKEKEKALTLEKCWRIFDYDPETGKLFWKEKISLKVKVGQEVGTTNKDGYRVVMVNFKLYSVHRIVFFMHRGFWPELIDHEDRNRANNRIENLRESNKSLNALNSDKHGRRRVRC